MPTLQDLLVVQRGHDGLAVLDLGHRARAAVEHREQQTEALLGGRPTWWSAGVARFAAGTELMAWTSPRSARWCQWSRRG